MRKPGSVAGNQKRPFRWVRGFAADNDSGTLGFYERLLHFLDFDILFLMAQLPSHLPQAFRLETISKQNHQPYSAKSA